ncbi:hypothetical protein EG329_012862 [Mollisiaceae sp. DMI_Dod_QoI]|nr:hypothetical protein EG329_012862 [Helotiales sp. DMI_Dod_QoI]
MATSASSESGCYSRIRGCYDAIRNVKGKIWFFSFLGILSIIVTGLAINRSLHPTNNNSKRDVACIAMDADGNCINGAIIIGRDLGPAFYDNAKMKRSFALAERDHGHVNVDASVALTFAPEIDSKLTSTATAPIAIISASVAEVTPAIIPVQALPINVQQAMSHLENPVNQLPAVTNDFRSPSPTIAATTFITVASSSLPSSIVLSNSPSTALALPQFTHSISPSIQIDNTATQLSQHATRLLLLKNVLMSRQTAHHNIMTASMEALSQVLASPDLDGVLGVDVHVQRMKEEMDTYAEFLYDVEHKAGKLYAEMRDAGYEHNA